MPETEPIVAIVVLLLLQVPPGNALLRLMVLVVHTDVGPDIAPGDAVTDIVLVADAVTASVTFCIANGSSA